MIKSLLLVSVFFFSIIIQAQVNTGVQTGSTLKNDSSIIVHMDSLTELRQEKLSLLHNYIYTKHPFYKFSNPVRLTVSKRSWQGKEGLFYTAVGLIIFFAFLKNSFSKYLQDLFRLFLRTTLKQRQIKEQLIEAPLPSLLFNILFMLSGALFLNLLFQHYSLGNQYNFWILLLYSVIGLTIVYLIKFISLKLCGWLFHLSEATDAYTFIVFTTNKILGIALLPFIVLLAFTAGVVYQTAFAFSILIVGIFFIYRFFLSYSSIHRQVKIDFFHFLLYLLAFEVAPLLLINKALLQFLS
jgi:hypothetical protein